MRWLLGLLISLSTSAYAAGPGFTNISEDDFKEIITDFSGALFHTSVSPASALGDVWGFEVGVIVGATKADAIERLSKEVDPEAKTDTLPHAGILGVLTFPYGITGEVNFLPEVKNSDVEFSTGSLAVKWTPTVIWELPVDLAVKVHAASSKIKWTQPISSVDTDVDYKQQVSGLTFQVSKKLLIFEPYLNLGAMKSKGDLNVNGSGTVFDTTYTTSQSASKTVTGSLMMIGANFNFGFIKLGAEFGKAFDANRASLKLSVYF